MTPASIHLLLFCLVSIAFAVIGFRAGRYQSSPKDYFRNSSPWKNAISLTASNLTLGTGLVYLVSGAQQIGTLMLVAPWALFAGYFVFGILVEKATMSGLGQGKNILADASQRIADATRHPCLLAKTISAILSALLMALLAFEIFASAKVMAPLLTGESNGSAEIVLSMAIFGVTILYTIMGGMNAVLAVDFLQVPLIILFLPSFVWIGIFSGNNEASFMEKLSRSTNISPAVVLAMTGAAINAFAGQFFSLLNIGAVSQVDAGERRTLATRVGLMTAIVLSCFVLIGICLEPSGTETGWSVLMLRFSEVSDKGPLGLIMSSLTVLGMTSILLTTTDAVVFSAIMFWYDNVTELDSTSSERDKRKLSSIRSIGSIAFVCGFGILAALNYLQPDPFYFLLSLAGGINVISPAIVLALLLACDSRTASAFTPLVLRVFIVLLVVSCAGNAILVVMRSNWVATLTNVMFASSSAFAVSVWMRARSAMNRPL